MPNIFGSNYQYNFCLCTLCNYLMLLSAAAEQIKRTNKLNEQLNYNIMTTNIFQTRKKGYRSEYRPNETELEEIKREVLQQNIFFSDANNDHYFFDFKFGNLWVSSVAINNELTEIEISITEA